MNQKLITISLLCACIFSKINAQVGIGTSTPDNSAILHLNNPNKGLLLTSIALTSVNDATTIPSPAIGLLIWNNGTGGFTPAGMYFWNNNQWNALSASNNSGNNTSINTGGWSTTGNNPGNYGGANTNLSLGTVNFDDLVFKVNSANFGRLGTNGGVSFGTSSSTVMNGVALGNNAVTTANESTAIGTNANVSGQSSVALGTNAQTNKNESAAIGANSKAFGFQSIALGFNSKTNSNSETALGFNSQTNGENSTALGSGANATGQFSTAVGYNATTNQANAIILGNSIANVGIGTSTPNVNTKIDVSGQFKLGTKGSIQKNQISFEAYTGGTNSLNSGQTTVYDIIIPAGYEPSSTRATITVTPAPDFVGNTTFSITNARLSSATNVQINLTNITSVAATLTHGHFYVTINEF